MSESKTALFLSIAIVICAWGILVATNVVLN